MTGARTVGGPRRHVNPAALDAASLGTKRPGKVDALRPCEDAPCAGARCRARRAGRHAAPGSRDAPPSGRARRRSRLVERGELMIDRLGRLGRSGSRARPGRRSHWSGSPGGHHPVLAARRRDRGAGQQPRRADLRGRGHAIATLRLRRTPEVRRVAPFDGGGLSARSHLAIRSSARPGRRGRRAAADRRGGRRRETRGHRSGRRARRGRARAAR